jgi:hypothetical protein
MFIAYEKQLGLVNGELIVLLEQHLKKLLIFYLSPLLTGVFLLSVAIYYCTTLASSPSILSSSYSGTFCSSSKMNFSYYSGLFSYTKRG